MSRIGIILPSLNTTLEPDFVRVGLANAEWFATRIPLFETTAAGLEQMNSHVSSAAHLIADVRPDVCVYGCTSGSFFGGTLGLRSLVDSIASIVAAPVIATSEAVVDALRALDIQSMSLVTPYLHEVNALEVSFFESCGFTVASEGGMGLSGREVQDVSPSEIMDLARSINSDQADAIFISCTNLRGLEVIATLEDELGKPVFSSNQAILWKLMHLLGKMGPIDGFGRLLAGTVPQPRGASDSSTPSYTPDPLPPRVDPFPAGATE